ncbi:GTP cyclohydrolase I FolE2 [Ahniella affigens]|uniref:GTP cyclohydrolase FolE2 n=2 Tax=Ahniella affigens TaxID=2021234 RepID=A0A2P1PTB0_9GAMM|nr:GTP cyclohydrolase I FolE2 [Ahniella affigens]
MNEINQANWSLDANPADATSADATKLLPDIAAAKAAQRGVLQWVGMRNVRAPLLIAASSGAAAERVAASVDVYVNLTDADARGIHMSRLYLLLESLAEVPVSSQSLRDLLGRLIESQAGLADAARIVLRFDLMLRRRALKSQLSGWKAYPVRMDARLGADGLRVQQELRIAYSSTCPMSAALSRQIQREHFEHHFGQSSQVPVSAVAEWLEQESGLAATPHAQRSQAVLNLSWQPDVANWPVLALIDQVEQALATPVQTAVKRIDEQTFARLNAENLMFCEDAARRVATVLRGVPSLADFEVDVAHFESLHAHDAVAVAVR